MITERELATILAALRFWQSGSGTVPVPLNPGLMDIATNDGEFVPLKRDEIDVLAERLNFGGTK